MARRTVLGASLEYSEQGRGEPLVLVHGSGSDFRVWHHQQALFRERFRTLVYSRRYHWPNDEIADGADYSMAQQVDDLRAMIHSLDLAPAHLVGHSYGAFLALVAAMREPDLARTLVLIEPPVVTLLTGFPPTPAEMLRLLLRRPRAAFAILKLGARGVAPATRAFRRGRLEAGIRTFGNAVFGRGGYDRLSEARKARIRDNSTNIEAELLGSGFLPLDGDEVRRVETPTLLITGERSIPLFHRLTDRLEELMPHTERVEIPGASHLVPEDAPAVLNAAVTEFLSRQRGEVTPG